MATPRVPFLLVSLLPAVLPLLPTVADADTRLVDCTRGRRIGTALRFPAGRSLIILVNGTCRESVVIERDDVTLKANAPGAGIEGDGGTTDVIAINGAKRIVIDGLVVTRGRNGILAENGADVTVKNKAFVHTNKQNGIAATRGSSVVVDDVDAKDNGAIDTVTGALGAGQSGVVISDGANGVVTNSRLSGNKLHGVSVPRSATARIGLTRALVPGPNLIERNTYHGVSVFQGSQALIDGNTLQDNTLNGVNISGGSATITNNTILRNSIGISVGNGGNATIGATDFSSAAPNVIMSNRSDGVQISNGGSAGLYGNDIKENDGNGINVSSGTGRLWTNNRIQANKSTGVSVSRGKLFQGRFGFAAAPRNDFADMPNRDVISGNGTGTNKGNGLSVSEGSAAHIEEAEINSNTRDGVALSVGSSLSLRNASVSLNKQHGISAYTGSTVQINGPVTIETNGTTGTGGTPGHGIIAGNGVTVQINGSLVAGQPNVKITGSTRDGINLGNRSSLFVNNTLIGSNGQHGIWAGTGSSVVVSGGTTIEGADASTGHGIGTSNGATVEVSGARIANHKWNGIYVGERSSLTVGTSAITANAQHGIGAGTGSTVRVSAMTIEGNGTGATWANGINAYNGSAVDVVDSFIKTHPDAGITLGNNSSLSVRNTTISGNQGNGISVWNGSSLNMDNTKIQANGSAGRWSAGISGSGATIEIHNGSEVTGHVDGDGINLSNRSGLSLNSSTISGNAGHGISAGDLTTVSASSSTITNNTGGWGISAFNGVTVNLMNSTISFHPWEGLHLNGSSTVLNGSIIADNGGNGIMVFNGGTVSGWGGNQIVRNGLTSNGAGINAYHAGNVNLSDTEISGNGGDGVSIVDTSFTMSSSSTATPMTITNNGGTGLTIGFGSVADLYNDPRNPAVVIAAKTGRAAIHCSESRFSVENVSVAGPTSPANLMGPPPLRTCP